MTVTRTLATASLLGVVASTWLLWTFDGLWPEFDGWDRMLAVLLLAAVWAFVAATVATVRQAFKRIDVVPEGAADELHVMEGGGCGVVMPDAYGGSVEVLDRVLA